MLENYDIIVVGAGHAGCEAAASAANLGAKTLLISMDMTKFANMSCNPAIGGIAKGQIVREIDALGGYTGIVTDKSTIQFRMLNRSKGPAMWSPRAQCDRTLFSIEWRKMLEETPNLDFWQDVVTSLLIKNQKVVGVKTQLNVEFGAKAVVLTNGTFLNGLMYIGKSQVRGGRASENAVTGITEQLVQLGFDAGRMKTGTPARVDGRSINFTKMQEQAGDVNPSKFSYLPEIAPVSSQRSCFLTYTNENVHEILREGLTDSPLYDGTIKGVGPRYCPSIETKIITFADKSQHQLFLEPEGWHTHEYYINGFSSSLPWEVQVKAIKAIAGLENAKIFRPGYAIEYDYFPPVQLKHSLETKQIQNLYFAGQINGTTGYEEAAAQGLMAGINAFQKINERAPLILGRDEAYIGVLIDDLVTKGVDEPYRMFTSRSEYRILLRQDNADSRLTEKAHKIGLASNNRFELLKIKEKSKNEITEFFKTKSVYPERVEEMLQKLGTSTLQQSTKLFNLISRPQIGINDLIPVLPFLQEFLNTLGNSSEEVIESAEIEMKYSGYIEREKLIAEKMHRLENIEIPSWFDFNKLHSLSTEARQKLTRIRPVTIGQASRISGVSPSDINVLLVFLGR